MKPWLSFLGFGMYPQISRAGFNLTVSRIRWKQCCENGKATLLQLWPFVFPVHTTLSYLCDTAGLKLKNIQSITQTHHLYTNRWRVRRTRVTSGSFCLVFEWAGQCSRGLCWRRGAELSWRRICTCCGGRLPCPVGTGVCTSPAGTCRAASDVPVGTAVSHLRSWRAHTRTTGWRVMQSCSYSMTEWGTGESLTRPVPSNPEAA